MRFDQSQAISFLFVLAIISHVSVAHKSRNTSASTTTDLHPHAVLKHEGHSINAAQGGSTCAEANTAVATETLVDNVTPAWKSCAMHKQSVKACQKPT